MDKFDAYNSIMLLIGDAIDAEVGEQREFKSETELVIDQIDRILKDVLDVPSDHYL